jgi:hypothetical protein
VLQVPSGVPGGICSSLTRTAMHTIKVKYGLITGRNGTFNLGGISVFRIDNVLNLSGRSDPHFRIDGLSCRTGKPINAGLSFDRKAAIELGNALIQLVEEAP